jgi:choline dehydrogenase-like flavoprotein
LSAENFFIMILPSRKASRFHGPATPKRHLTTAGGRVLSITGRKMTALQSLRGRLLVPAQVDPQRYSAQSWTDFVQKISHHVVFFPTYRINHCLKRDQSATRKWCHITSERSVLDRDNPAHDLDNLYVLDASFFPSSGGINPSLTIVANSLRVSDKIARRP